MLRLLCLFGIHHWVVDVPAHSVEVLLRSGRVITDCTWCGAWRQMKGDPDASR